MYSFQIKAADKESAKLAVADKFDEIMEGTLGQEASRALLVANANEAIDLLAEDDTKDVAVSCNGNENWNGSGEFSVQPFQFRNVSVNRTVSVSVTQVPRV